MTIRISVPTNNNHLIYMGRCPKVIGLKGTIDFGDDMPIIAYCGDKRNPTIYIFQSKKQPTNIIVPRRLIDNVEKFHSKPSEGAFRVMLDIPHRTSDLKKIDICLAEFYTSPKQTGDPEQPFIHKHDYPLPNMYRCGKTIMIAGGKFGIKTGFDGIDWIYW